MLIKQIIGGLVLIAALSACSQRDVRLAGERETLREDDPRVQTEAPSVQAGQGANPEVAISLPKQNTNATWTHRNGGPAHRISHPALGAQLTALWSGDIGTGVTRRHRITAEPIVAGGRVFTLDSQATVTAHSTAGAQLWQSDLTPSTDRSSDASGGGLAFGGNRLFVTTGFGALSALDPETGATLWTQRLEASAAGAPTVFGDLVYLVSQDNTAWALETDTGRIRWTVTGTPSTANLVGGASPAVNNRLVFFPFSTGEVLGVFRKGGVRLWNAPVSGQRSGRVYARISDISSDPVIAGNRVYIGNQSGRVVALDAANGERLWTANDGALNPVWPVGNSLFIVSDLGQLVRLNARDGRRIWAVDLPLRKERRFARAKSVYAHYGPILAGGRLFVGSSDGYLRAFDPRSGALVEQIEIPGGVASSPVVAGGVLYVISGRGKLLAFR